MAIPSTPKVQRKAQARNPDPATFDAIEAALTRLINPPSVTCASNRTVGTVDWTVVLYSDDSVRIVTNDEPVATGRFVTESHVTAWGSLSVDARIVDVTPVGAVSDEILRSLTSDLTFFAMRAGRFSGRKAG
jgi:hypothetical protein